MRPHQPWMQTRLGPRQKSAWTRKLQLEGSGEETCHSHEHREVPTSPRVHVTRCRRPEARAHRSSAGRCWAKFRVPVKQLHGRNTAEDGGTPKAEGGRVTLLGRDRCRHVSALQQVAGRWWQNDGGRTKVAGCVVNSCEVQRVGDIGGSSRVDLVARW